MALSGVQGNWLLPPWIRVNFNRINQDDHLNSYFYKGGGSRLFLILPRWSS